MDKTIIYILKELKEKISKKYHINEMRLFGSTGRGDRREDSDIDVLIILPNVNRQIEENLFDIAYDLELEHDCIIDLIVLSDDAVKGLYSTTPIYRKAIEEGAII